MLPARKVVILLGRQEVVSEEGVPPEYSSSLIGDTNYTTVEVTFDQDINSPGADYKAGVTIKKNSISQTISTGTRQANKAIVHYVITPAADINDTITFEYDDDVGDLEADDDATDLLDVSAQSSINYIGSTLYFNEEESSALIGAI